MSSNDIAIRVTNLSKRYEIYAAPRDRLKQFVLPPLQSLVGQPQKQYFREFWALQDISFEVNKGEAVGIIGRNGAGKSTLLQLICGTLSPTTGSVEVEDTVAALLELGSGFNPEFTGRENVYMNASVLGLTQEETDKKFDEIAAFADIGDFLEQPTKVYSSGMLMRLAFAVNTCVDPEILIVDEALGVGDAPFQSKCFKRLRQLINDGTSILFVSHDIATVRSICSRALWLKDGHAEMWGDAMSTAKEYEKFCWQAQGVVFDNSTGNSLEQKTKSSDELGATPDAPEHTSADIRWCANRLSPLESSDRYGNKDLVIEGFEIRNLHGEIVTRCSYGEELEFIYYLEAGNDINSDMTIGLVFRDKRGSDVYAAHNFESRDRLNVKTGQRVIASSRLRIPLTHQEYVIQIGVFGFKGGAIYENDQYDFSNAVMWDGVEKAMVLTVDANKPQPLGGPVHVPMYFNFTIMQR